MANEPNYSSNPSKDEPKKEKVRVIPLEYIDEFPGHPFKVLDDESMQKLMNSIPPELKYVRIITTTTSGGIDRDENTEGEKAVTATVLVTPEQAELLSMYENVTSLHFVLVYRGDKATADAYLKTQDDYLNSHKGQTPAIEENKEDVSEGEQNG